MSVSNDISAFLEKFSGLVLKTIQSIDVGLMSSSEESVMTNHMSYFMYQFKKIAEQYENSVVIRGLAIHSKINFHNQYYDQLISAAHAELAEQKKKSV